MDLSAMEAQVAELRAAVQQSLDGIDESRKNLQALDVKTQARDGEFTMALDSTGRITELTFHSKAFQKWTPDELGSAIVEAYAEARDDLQKKLVGQLPSAPFGGMSMENLLDPHADFSAIIPSSLLDEILPNRGRKEMTDDV
jgi:DNA-binding protein YbaB